MFAFLIFVFTVSTLSHAENITSLPSDQEDYYCLLPPYPENGSYIVRNHSSATPGQRYPYVKLDISCNTGYMYNSTNKSIFCINGEWSATMHTCVRDLIGFCTLPTQDLTLRYRCLQSPEKRERSRECESLVPVGTLVIPVCRAPAFYSVTELPDMHCRNGKWDYNPICKPACGFTTQHRQLEGTSSNHLELPWYAVIYEKEGKSYTRLCGGSLITTTKIISAARCFYDNYLKHLRRASYFTVAINKIYSKYNDTRERYSQYSDVDEIIIPETYRGDETKFEDDIAIVVVKRPFFFDLSIRPVCLDFDNDLDITQLAVGNSGKTVGWSDVINNGDMFQVLNVVDISYMKYEECIPLLAIDDREYLTKNKFCAKSINGSSFSFGGDGLAFLDSTTQRYYLRGVRSDFLFSVGFYDYLFSFTSIMKHEHFIKQHL